MAGEQVFSLFSCHLGNVIYIEIALPAQSNLVCPYHVIPVDTTWRSDSHIIQIHTLSNVH